MTDTDILDGILRREGGYVHHPHDRGSCTNFGITRRTLQEWRGTPVSCADVRTMEEGEARAIYQARYLAPFADVEPELKPQVVDIAVNSGVSTARTLLARARANAMARTVGQQLVLERALYYGAIVKADPSQAVFIKGWLNRCFEYLT